MPRRTSPRLRDFDYHGPLAAHLTFVTRGRRHLFTNHRLFELAEQSLNRAAAVLSCEVRAFCFMPDHLHVLVEVPEGQTLTEFARRFKQLSGYALKAETGMFAWQVSYYDHILRREESLEEVAMYIWANPVAAGLATEPSEYALSGPRELLEATAGR